MANAPYGTLSCLRDTFFAGPYLAFRGLHTCRLLTLLARLPTLPRRYGGLPPAATHTCAARNTYLHYDNRHRFCLHCLPPPHAFSRCDAGGCCCLPTAAFTFLVHVDLPHLYLPTRTFTPFSDDIPAICYGGS